MGKRSIGTGRRMGTNRKSAWDLVTRDWDDCSIGFDCICGRKELQITDEPIICDECGRKYIMTVLFEVEEPNNV